MKTEEMIEIMNAHLRGEKIEVRSLSSDENWEALPIPSWNWGLFEYRVAPKKISINGINWPNGTTADDWERVIYPNYRPKCGDVLVSQVGNCEIILVGPEGGYLTVSQYGNTTGGQWYHVYRRKRVPQMPKAKVFWVKNIDRKTQHLVVAIREDALLIGHTWQPISLLASSEMQWSGNRVDWYNFYGEKIQNK